MRYTPIAAGQARLSTADRLDAMLCRSDWTWADYLAEGGRWHDLELSKRGKPAVSNAARDHAAYVWAGMNCPRSKRGVIAERECMA